MTPANIICYVTILLVAVFTFAQTVNGIKCFQCNSFEHPACANITANDTNSPFFHKCQPRDNHQMFCRKTVQTVLDTPQFTRITRSCGWFLYKTNKSLCQVTDTDFKLETSCQCFTDGCNGGTVLTPISGVVALVLGGLLLS
ncbi:uncharacterized protein LOC123016318 [Tribolium madens]|uniref:uncharacterized protein LOC123016318 n=1 Tax=Tribolium madens TaxID=41895 RepID=UPI001CF728BA|nr:uncharacterized protein LOC123016318 [Tribolium madens]